MARILIVEDETIIAEDIRASLEETGFTIVATAVSGEEAVRIAASEMPDAVLMDIYLRNEMDGTEAAEIIHRKHGIPIIFLTAFSDDALLEKARQAGPFGFLIKPFDSRELKTTLEMALYKARADEERRILEKHVFNTQKYDSLRTLTAGVAHNFSNMLTAMLGNLELAIVELQRKENRTEGLIKNAMSSTRQAVDLCKQMRTYVGQCGEKRSVIDLADLVIKLKDILSVGMGDKADLSYRGPTEGIFVKSAYSLINQIVSNLVINGIEATDGTKVSVTLSVGTTTYDPSTMPDAALQLRNMPRGEYAFIQVADNGTGMSSDVLHKAFDPFFSTKFTGRGLGLPAALGAAESHHGTLVVEDTSPQGTVVRAYLPRESRG
jgi:signal transduction histidine kinase